MLVCCKTDHYINSLNGEDEGEFFYVYYTKPTSTIKYRRDIFNKNHHKNLYLPWTGLSKSEIKKVNKEFKKWNVNGYEIIPNCKECRYRFICITGGFDLP